MDVGLGQGSALSSLLLSAVVEMISRKATTSDILRKLIYADDLAVVADSEADLQERFVEWKEIFGRHGLRDSLEKTEVLCVQRDNVVYLGGAVCGDGGTETEIRRRIQAGTSAWRKVVGGWEIDRCVGSKNGR